MDLMQVEMILRALLEGKNRTATPAISRLRAELANAVDRWRPVVVQWEDAVLSDGSRRGLRRGSRGQAGRRGERPGSCGLSYGGNKARIVARVSPERTS